MTKDEPFKEIRDSRSTTTPHIGTSETAMRKRILNKIMVSKNGGVKK